MATIFVSYSREDTELVRRLVAYLKAREIQYWLDLERIPAGEDWSDRVWSGLQSCDLMLLVISPSSMNSKEVADEWKYYQSTGKPIIPVLAENTSNIHYKLSALNYVDFQRRDFLAACSLLEQEIQNAMAELNGPAGEPTLPERPTPTWTPPEEPPTTALLRPLDIDRELDRTTTRIDPELVKAIEERLHYFNEKMLLEFVGYEDPDKHLELKIYPGRSYVIGRTTAGDEPDVDLNLLGGAGQGISRKHATLMLDGDTLFIKDLNSTNYTFVEGRKLRGNEQLALKSGDRIQTGNFLFMIHFRERTE